MKKVKITGFKKAILMLLIEGANHSDIRDIFVRNGFGLMILAANRRFLKLVECVSENGDHLKITDYGRSMLNSQGDKDPLWASSSACKMVKEYLERKRECA